MNHAEVHGTISTYSYLTNVTLPFPFFTTTKSPEHPRVHQRGDAGTGGYVSEPSPSPP